MSLFPGTAIRARLRAIVTGAAGTVRTVTGNTFGEDYWTGADARAGHLRALEKPSFFFPFIPYRLKAQRTSDVGDIREFEITPSMLLEYALPAAVDTPATRDAALGQAEADVDMIAQALGWEGNLDYPTTGIISGYLEFLGVTSQVEDWIGRRLVLRLNFRGLVHVTAAVS